MKKIDDTKLDALKDIILLYANTPPDSIDNLKLIKRELFFSRYSLAKCPDYSFWEFDCQGAGILDLLIDWILKIQAVDAERAKAILDDQERQNEFASEILGYKLHYPPDKQCYQKLYDSAFRQVYGYTVARSCPCSPLKKEILERAHYLLAGLECDPIVESITGGFADEDMNPRWIKERVNCLRCDHLYFVEVLKSLIATGQYHGPSYRDRDEIEFPGDLSILPFNLLSKLLPYGPYAVKIKRCPICEKFFYAEDRRQKICRDPSCFRVKKRLHKRAQRLEHPEIYAT